MSESRLIANIRKAIKARYPRAWVVKLSDRYTRGLPDLLVQFQVHGKSTPGMVVYVETKTKTGSLSKIQEATHCKIARAGGFVLVARTVNVVLDWMHELGAVP